VTDAFRLTPCAPRGKTRTLGANHVGVFPTMPSWPLTCEGIVPCAGAGHPDEWGREARNPCYFTVSFFEPAGLPSSITSTS
jgi:hypothetical protein